MRRHVGNDLIEVLAIVVFTISLQVWQTNSQGSQGISAQDQFDLMVNNTKSIASKLGEIYSSSCPQDCPCSQDLCQPLGKGTFLPASHISDPGLYNCSSKLREKLMRNEQPSYISWKGGKWGVMPFECASSLMETVYTSKELENYINVFSFGGNNSLYKEPTTVQFNPEDPESHPELTDLKKQIDTLKVDGAKTTLDDFLVALNLTLTDFNESASKANARPPLQPNIILFTDGFFTSSLNQSSVTDVRNRLVSQGVNLFIYGIDANGNDAGLISFLDNVNGFSGIYQSLTPSNLSAHDPLFSMRSYFGFLAASHRAW
ncbi:hypothetical protein R1flu_025610 [Riccia fluitans]|uniref:VWFA domain-containing protein n=1 Tax=Riccia fluitans TaxID=41844 RepID=A0ABD1Y2D5_9MARC